MGKDVYEQDDSEDYSGDIEMDQDEENFDMEEEDYNYISAEDSNSDILDKDNEEEESYDNKRNWGNQKKNYYHDDNESSGDSSQEEGHFQEAKNIYKQQIAPMNEDDFGLDYIEPKKHDDESDSEQQQEQNQEILAEEKKQKQQADNEEALILLQEIQKSMEITEENDFQISQSKILNQNKDLVKNFSKNFPQVSKDIHMSYMSCILFYFLLKRDGESVKTHPVIKYLSEFKQKLSDLGVLNEEFKAFASEIIMTAQMEKQQDEEEVPTKKQQQQLSKKQQNKKQKKNNKQLQQQQQKKGKKQQQQLVDQILNLGNQQDSEELQAQKLMESDEEDNRIRKGLKNKLNKNKFDSDDDDGLLFGNNNNNGNLDDDDDDIDLDNIKLDNITLGSGQNQQQQNNSNQKNTLNKKSKKVKKQKDNGNNNLEDQYYEMVKQKQIEKKLEKVARKEQKKIEEELRIDSLNTLKEVKEEGPRRINQTILRNEGGIKRRRNNVISRVKLKGKYKTALQKQVASGNKKRLAGKEKSREYGGEAIKSGVVRGVQLG